MTAPEDTNPANTKSEAEKKVRRSMTPMPDDKLTPESIKPAGGPAGGLGAVTEE